MVREFIENIQELDVKEGKGLHYRKSSNPPPPAIASQIMCCMYFAHWQWRAGAAASPASQARPAFT